MFKKLFELKITFFLPPTLFVFATLNENNTKTCISKRLNIAVFNFLTSNIKLEHLVDETVHDERVSSLQLTQQAAGRLLQLGGKDENG